MSALCFMIFIQIISSVSCTKGVSVIPTKKQEIMFSLLMTVEKYSWIKILFYFNLIKMLTLNLKHEANILGQS